MIRARKYVFIDGDNTVLEHGQTDPEAFAHMKAQFPNMIEIPPYLEIRLGDKYDPKLKRATPVGPRLEPPPNEPPPWRRPKG